MKNMPDAISYLSKGEDRTVGNHMENVMETEVVGPQVNEYRTYFGIFGAQGLVYTMAYYYLKQLA